MASYLETCGAWAQAVVARAIERLRWHNKTAPLRLSFGGWGRLAARCGARRPREFRAAASAEASLDRARLAWALQAWARRADAAPRRERMASALAMQAALEAMLFVWQRWRAQAQAPRELHPAHGRVPQDLCANVPAPWLLVEGDQQAMRAPRSPAARGADGAAGEVPRSLASPGSDAAAYGASQLRLLVRAVSAWRGAALVRLRALGVGEPLRRHGAQGGREHRRGPLASAAGEGRTGGRL